MRLAAVLGASPWNDGRQRIKVHGLRRQAFRSLHDSFSIVPMHSIMPRPRPAEPRASALLRSRCAVALRVHLCRICSRARVPTRRRRMNEWILGWLFRILLAKRTRVASVQRAATEGESEYPRSSRCPRARLRAESSDGHWSRLLRVLALGVLPPLPREQALARSPRWGKPGAYSFGPSVMTRIVILTYSLGDNCQSCQLVILLPFSMLSNEYSDDFCRMTKSNTVIDGH
jgi:hypothetical protein